MDEVTTEEIDCPECFSKCWMCSDYKHQHGPRGSKLPPQGGAPRCKVENHDKPCPMCGGSKKVVRTVVYERTT